jgi:hypothetical protein
LAGYAQQHLFQSIRNTRRRMRPRKPSQS